MEYMDHLRICLQSAEQETGLEHPLGALLSPDRVTSRHTNLDDEDGGDDANEPPDDGGTNKCLWVIGIATDVSPRTGGSMEVPAVLRDNRPNVVKLLPTGLLDASISGMCQV